MARLTELAATVRKRPALRDLLWVLALGLIAFWASRPAMSGEGITLADSQILGSICAIMVAAVGLNFLVGHARLVSLGQGAFFAIGAYASAWLTLDGGWHPLLAMVAALVIAGVIGALLAMASMRLRGPSFAMITLVVTILVERILVEWAPLGRLSGYPNTLDHGSGLLEPIKVFGMELDPPLFAGIPADVILAILIVLVVALYGYRNVSQSSWGRSLRAIGTSEHLAAHLGVNVYARKVAAMAVASVYGAVGGVFYVQVFAHLQPESFNIYLSITIILAVMLGGAGTVLGPIVGSIVIVLLQQTDVLQPLVTAQKNISESWYLSTPGLIGLLLILTLAVLPQGLVGGVQGLVHRFRPAAVNADVEPDAGAAAPTAEAAEMTEQEESPRETSGEDVLLTVRGVRRMFGGLTAVDGVDLTVRAGQVHALIGPNGAGKTTLANLITGVYAPNEGEIALRGQRIDTAPTYRIIRSGIARTFQTPLLFGHETVEENVLSGFAHTGTLPFWKAWLKLPSEYRRDRVMRERTAELMELVGLKGFEHLEAGSLSYGKQRALEIARALASDPSLLILDEPAAGLNTAETAELGQLMLRLRARGLAMIIVEHHMELVTMVSDEVTCMNTGSVLAHGKPAEVLADPHVVEAYLGVSAVAEPAGAPLERTDNA
ncbi:branched-chain amino acid ABC transporter ATP-binding protein/permease [Nocardioides dubius]